MNFPITMDFDCTSIYIPIDELTFERKFSLLELDGGTQSILSLLRPPTHVGKLPLSMRIGIAAAALCTVELYLQKQVDYFDDISCKVKKSLFHTKFLIWYKISHFAVAEGQAKAASALVFY